VRFIFRLDRLAAQLSESVVREAALVPRRARKDGGGTGGRGLTVGRFDRAQPSSFSADRRRAFMRLLAVAPIVALRYCATSYDYSKVPTAVQPFYAPLILTFIRMLWGPLFFTARYKRHRKDFNF
jgi:hypothetical protein